MRSDFAKILVERERIGVKGAALKRRRNRRVANRDLENAPTKVSMGRHRQYGWEAKQLNENLSPLKRFIESNVGRVWDNVYSEIREHVNFANTVQKHILQHLWQYVERNAVLNDGGVACYPPTSYRSWRDGLVPIGHDSFFIHPDTGLLSRGKKGKPQPRSRPPSSAGVKRQVGQSGFEEVQVKKGGNVFIKADGIWFAADMRPLPEGFDWGKGVPRTRQERRYNAIGGSTVVDVPFVDEGPTDRLLGRRVGVVPARNRFSSDNEHLSYYGRLDRYCAGKGHQLDTKALRRLGLQNEA